MRVPEISWNTMLYDFIRLLNKPAYIKGRCGLKNLFWTDSQGSSITKHTF